MGLFSDWLFGIALLAVIGLISWIAYGVISNIYLHPLARFPGPKIAAATRFWKAYIECVVQRSMHTELAKLHAQYGEIIRISPNELHFSNPQAYHDIYNNQNRWDKEERLYHSFGEDRSSFGFLTYKEAKERKDVLGKMFSPKATLQTQGIVLAKIDALCKTFEQYAKTGEGADLNWAWRCMTLDIITYLCFGKSVDAIQAPGYKAPFVVAIDESITTFIAFKHFEIYKQMIINCPPNLAKKLSPPSAGMIDLQVLLRKQIEDLVENPEGLEHLSHNMTIYHQLLDKSAYRSGVVPSVGSLYEESQALMFAGADTTANALLLSSYYLMKQPDTYKALKDEIKSAWPNIQDAPQLRDIEQMPYLNAVIKEGLRMSSGVVAGLLRHVPTEGAKICDTFIPGGTVVSCGSTFVHYNPDVFPSPHEFKPERWIENSKLDNWLVPFSKGPRACLGLNLAMQELRLTFAHVYRRFEMTLNPASPTQLTFRDVFLPAFYGPHVMANFTAATA